MCGIIQTVERATSPGRGDPPRGACTEREDEKMKTVTVKKHVANNDELTKLHGMLRTMGFKKTSSCYWFETWERSDGYAYEVIMDN